jgi:hypothetical protein
MDVAHVAKVCIDLREARGAGAKKSSKSTLKRKGHKARFTDIVGDVRRSSSGA